MRHFQPVEQRLSPTPSELARMLLPPDARFACVDVNDATLDSLDPLFPEEICAGTLGGAAKRQREFRAGRHVARRVLEDLGRPAGPVSRGDDGVPIFPHGIAASITHTGTTRTFAAAAGIAGALGLGLDAERMRSFPDDLLARIVGPDEQSRMVEWRSWAELAVLAFSAKEAFYKCVFPRTRQFLGFHDVDFELIALDDGGDFLSGAFTLRSALSGKQTGPSSLDGRFIADSHRVITAVVWQQ